MDKLSAGHPIERYERLSYLDLRADDDRTIREILGEDVQGWEILAVTGTPNGCAVLVGKVKAPEQPTGTLRADALVGFPKIPGWRVE